MTSGIPSSPAASMILGPSGETLAGPVTGADQILVADIDVGKSVALKQIHDITGVYQRFDLFSLSVDQTRPEPIHLSATSVVGSGLGLGPRDGLCVPEESRKTTGVKKDGALAGTELA